MTPVDFSGPVPTDPEGRHRWLLACLEREGEVRQVGVGRYEITVDLRDEAGQAYLPVTVIVSDEQWSELCDVEVNPDLWVSELLASRRPDEPFLVFYDGDLHRSVREELPPERASGPYLSRHRAQTGLFAYPSRPDGTPERGH